MRLKRLMPVLALAVALMAFGCSETTTLSNVDGGVVADGDSAEDTDTVEGTDDVEDVEGTDTADLTEDDIIVTDGDVTDPDPDAIEEEGFEDGDIEEVPTPCGIAGTLNVSNDFVDDDNVYVMLFRDYPLDYADNFQDGAYRWAMYNIWSTGRSVQYGFENLAAGTYWVMVQAEKPPYLAVPPGGPFELTVDGTCNIGDLDIYLGVDNPAAGSISGNVVLADPWGDPDQYLMFIAAIPTDQWPPNSEDVWPSSMAIIIPSDLQYTGRSFEYSLENLPAGSYMVFATLDNLESGDELTMTQYATPLTIDLEGTKDHVNIDMLFRGQQADGDVEADIEVPRGSIGGDLHVSQTVVDDGLRVGVMLFDESPFADPGPSPIAATELTQFPNLKASFSFDNIPQGAYWLVAVAAEANAPDFENPIKLAMHEDSPFNFVPDAQGFDAMDLYLDVQSPNLGSISGTVYTQAEAATNSDYRVYCAATDEEPTMEGMPPITAITIIESLAVDGNTASSAFVLPNLAADDYWVLCVVENHTTGSILAVDYDGPHTLTQGGPGSHIEGLEYFLGIGDPNLGTIAGTVETRYPATAGFSIVVGLYDQPPGQGVNPVGYKYFVTDGQTTQFPYLLDNLQSDDYWVGTVLLAGMNRLVTFVQYENSPISLDVDNAAAKDFEGIDMYLNNGVLSGTLDVLPPFQMPGSVAWLSLTPPVVANTLLVQVPLTNSTSTAGHMEGSFTLGGLYPATWVAAVMFDSNDNGVLDAAEQTAAVLATPQNYVYPDQAIVTQNFSASFPQ